MNCEKSDLCGGCTLRNLSIEEYHRNKREKFERIISSIGVENVKINQPIFIDDGCRRRASFAFEFKKNQLCFGFNAASSHKIIDINKCILLTDGVNKILPFIRSLITAICQEPYSEKKGKKTTQKYITRGDVFVCEAYNGTDIVLEYDAPLELNHRMIIFELVSSNDAVVRISHRKSAFAKSETIIEKSKPYIKAGSYDVYIPAGTFLQPSAEGQEALGNLVKKYTDGITGNIADLFCGVGTFSYLLAGKDKVKITAIDSSEELLKGFSDSINRNQICNIKVINKNLFKYPLDENELKEFDAIIFDPPRAGAKAVCEKLASATNKPDILVAISCNPNTFVNDAKTLIAGGYALKEVTMVDQFIYSNHSELVAFFTKVQM